MRPNFVVEDEKINYLTDQLSREYGVDFRGILPQILREPANPVTTFYVLDTQFRQGRGRAINWGIASLRYLVEGRGYSMYDWWLDFDLDRYRLISGRQARDIADLAIVLTKYDDELKALKFSIPDKDGIPSQEYIKNKPQYCDTLKSKSIDAFQTAKESIPPGPLMFPKTFPKAFGKCIQCHLNKNGEAPYIPFDDELTFQNALAKKALANRLIYRISDKSGEDRMPPKTGLSHEEQKEVMDYLRSIGFANVY